MSIKGLHTPLGSLTALTLARLAMDSSCSAPTLHTAAWLTLKWYHGLPWSPLYPLHILLLNNTVVVFSNPHQASQASSDGHGPDNQEVNICIARNVGLKKERISVW